MGKKDPAVLFYTSDFLSGVALMSMKERGQYITLLCLQREHGHMTLREMEKVAGKLSPEVRSKFEEDPGGKLFNARMEEEIQKRIAHSRKQRENVLKRWNKKNESSGNTAVSTMVIPLGNGNGSNYNSLVLEEAETSSAREEKRTGNDPGLGRVMGLYMDKIERDPSPDCLDKLRGYYQSLGEAICTRAIYRAMDAGGGMRKWSYVQGIFRKILQQGVRTIEDWDRLDALHEKEKQGGGSEYEYL